MAKNPDDASLYTFVSKPEAAAVRDAAKQRGLSVAHLIRQALNVYFEREHFDVRLVETRPVGKPDERQARRLRISRRVVVTASMLSRRGARP